MIFAYDFTLKHLFFFEFFFLKINLKKAVLESNYSVKLDLKMKRFVINRIFNSAGLVELLKPQRIQM